MLGIPVPELFLMLLCLLMNRQNTRSRSVLMIAVVWDVTCSQAFGVICPPTGASSLLRNVDRFVAGNTGLIGEDCDGYGLDGPEL